MSGPVTPNKLERYCRNMLDLKSTEEIPSFFPPLLEKFMISNPADINFNVELAKGNGTGGNGFGLIICMDEYCFNETLLDADPSQSLQQQRDNGFGSFFNYQNEMHCTNPDHVKGRNERCKNLGIPIPATSDPLQNLIEYRVDQAAAPLNTNHRSAPASTSNAFQLSNDIPTSSAGPSRHPASALSQPTRSSSSASNLTRQSSSSETLRGTSSSILQPSQAPNLSVGLADREAQSVDIKPDLTTLLRAAKTLEAADDDSDIEELTGEAIPLSMRKRSNRDNPILLQDDDENVSDLPRASAKIPPLSDWLKPSPPRLSNKEIRRRYKEEYTHLVASYISLKKHKISDLGVQRMDFLTSNHRDESEWIPPPKEIVDKVPSLRHLVRLYEASDRARNANLNLSAPRLSQLAPFRSTPSPSHIADETKPFATSGLDRGSSSTDPISCPTRALPLSDTKAHVLGVGAANTVAATSERSSLESLQQFVDIFSKFTYGRLAAATGGPSMPTTSLTAPSTSPFLPVIAGYHAGEAEPSTAALASLFNTESMGLDDDDDGLYGYEYDRPTTDQDLQTFFANSLHEFGDDADVDGALKALKLKDVHDKIPGLNVTLMPHQVLGVAFMIKQERLAGMRGGMLLDEQGLGKTIQTIAVLVANPSQDKRVKTTLIVGPLALLHQWKTELETRTSKGYKIGIHHGPKRTRSINELKSCDVVLTTYGTLAAEHGIQPSKVKKKKDGDDDDDEDFERPPPRQQGPLFRVNFYRVVLDEAQFIRNRNTRAAKACFDLKSQMRWSLTGTPIVNNLTDIYSQLRFLLISPQRDWKAFRSHIASMQRKRPKLAAKRAQAILKSCSIRRNKDTELNGVRLLTLPEKTVEVEELDFSPEERDMYTAIEQRMQVRFNRYLRRGTVLRNYSDVLSMLLRLKQLCCHPYLLRRDPNDAYRHPHDMSVSDEELFGNGNQDACDEDDTVEIERALKLMGPDWIKGATKTLKKRYLDDQERSNDPDEILGSECAICYEPFSNEYEERLSECYHSFCSGCVKEYFTSGDQTNGGLTDAQIERNIRSCPCCRKPMERQKLFRASVFFRPPAEDDADVKPAKPSTSSQKRKRVEDESDDDLEGDDKKDIKGKGKAKVRSKVLKDDDEEDKMEMTLEDVEEIRPSAKMKCMARLIDQYLNEDPHTKIIVFSQFTSYIDLCQQYMQQTHGVPSLCYVGSMKPFERDDVVATFNKPAAEGSPRLMFISLKCGGVGLNLTVASKVISLDFAWNAATEMQAWDRCHRIGQTRPVTITRAVITGTVEQRILKLQDSKKQLADGALGEGAGGKLGRLSVRDLVNLFGLGPSEE